MERAAYIPEFFAIPQSRLVNALTNFFLTASLNRNKTVVYFAIEFRASRCSFLAKFNLRAVERPFEKPDWKAS